MNTAARLSTIAATYQRDRAQARANFAPAGVGRSTGRRRDQAEARARRRYKASLAKVAPLAKFRLR